MKTFQDFFKHWIHNVCNQPEKANSGLNYLLREAYPDRDAEWRYNKIKEIKEKIAEDYTNGF